MTRFIAASDTSFDLATMIRLLHHNAGILPVFVVSGTERDTVDGHRIAGSCKLVTATTEDGREVLLIVPDLERSAVLIDKVSSWPD